MATWLTRSKHKQIQTNSRTIAIILFPICDLIDNCEKGKILEEEARSFPSVPSPCVHILLCCHPGWFLFWTQGDILSRPLLKLLLLRVMFCCVFTQGDVLLCFHPGWCSVVFLLRVMFCCVFTQGDVLLYFHPGWCSGWTGMQTPRSNEPIMTAVTEGRWSAILFSWSTPWLWTLQVSIVCCVCLFVNLFAICQSVRFTPRPCARSMCICLCVTCVWRR